MRGQCKVTGHFGSPTHQHCAGPNCGRADRDWPLALSPPAQHHRHADDADAHSDHACSPPHSPTFLALSQSQPPLLSLYAELLELVVLHSTTRPPTQPSANTKLGIESHAQLAYPDATPRPSTDLSGLEAVATLPNGFSYLQVQANDHADYTLCDRSPGSTPFSVDICWLVLALVFIQRPDAELIAARVFDASLFTRRKIAQIQGVHAADADRMHTDRDLRPLLVEPPWSSSLTPPRTSPEELKTTSFTPLRLMIVLGGHDGSGA
ncbi:hypothetical protein B0H14DRAFT_3868415 [Mycena olivaceomarginata]|nr:hypothetical protein B0H14DRAFT_3868415 [Mycena olivaceomarginata]